MKNWTMREERLLLREQIMAYETRIARLSTALDEMRTALRRAAPKSNVAAESVSLSRDSRPLNEIYIPIAWTTSTISPMKANEGLYSSRGSSSEESPDLLASL